MAIAIVQKSAEFNFAGSLTCSPSLTGVTAGNLLVVTFSHTDYGATAPTFTVSDGASYALASDDIGSYQAAGIYYLKGSSVSSGTHTAVITASSGIASNSYGTACLVEISGCDPNTPFDKQASNDGNNSHPATGSTATLSQASEIVLTVFAGQGSLAGATDPPAGTGTYIDLYSDLSVYYGIAASQIVSATTAVNANLGTITTPTNWSAALATFRAASTSAYTLSGAYGAYAITGENVSFSQFLIAGFGSYNISGISQSLSGQGTGFVILANSGTYNYIGAPSISDSSVTAVFGSYALTGGVALFPSQPTYSIIASGGIYAIGTFGTTSFLLNATGMPKLLGLEYFNALALLQADSLTAQCPVEVKITAGPASTQGLVIGQSIPVGTKIIPGTTIVLTVNKPQGQFPAVEQNQPIPYWYFLQR